MFQRGDRPRLLVKAPHKVAILCVVGMHDFDGDLPLDLHLLRLIDLPHPSVSQLLGHPVLPVDDLSDKRVSRALEFDQERAVAAAIDNLVLNIRRRIWDRSSYVMKAGFC